VPPIYPGERTDGEYVIQVGQFARLSTWNNMLRPFCSDEAHLKRSRGRLYRAGCSAPVLDGGAGRAMLRTDVGVKIFVICLDFPWLLGLYDPQPLIVR
jgi:hypothetical protein